MTKIVDRDQDFSFNNFPDWGPAEEVVVEDDLFVTDCEDPFLDQVIEVLGNLIILDLDCDVAVSLGHVRVGGGTTVALGDLEVVDGSVNVVIEEPGGVEPILGITIENGDVNVVSEEEEVVDGDSIGANAEVTDDSASASVTSGDDTIVEVDTDDPPL